MRRKRLINDTVVKCYYKERTIAVRGTIQRRMLPDVASALWKLQNGNPTRPIFFVINSKGGCAITALMIAALLRNSIVPVYTHVEDLAASAAVFIFLAGKRRSMAFHARLVVHKGKTVLRKRSAKEQLVIDYYTTVVNRWLVGELRFATHMTKRNAAAMLSTERSLSAHEALKLRFATDVLQ